MDNKIKIVNDYPQLDAIAWRQYVTECPHCEKGNTNDIEMWYREIDTVVLNPQRCQKPAYFIIISVCPECGEKSWNHFQLEYFWGDVPEYVIKAIEGELNRRKKQYKDDWENSLCIKCSELNKVEVTNLYYRVECLDNRRAGSCESECENFKHTNKLNALCNLQLSKCQRFILEISPFLLQ